jgi:uncharacterized protein YyaL (SSP411 family)
LLAEREKRARPGRDDKILADWNGLTIAALARASAVFDAPDFLAAAEAAFAFVAANLRDANGDLLHAWRDGRAGAAGLLDDYAAMARAALSLFEATGTPAYLAHAEAWADSALKLFGDGDGGFFMSADGGDRLIVRPRPPHDGATPSGASLMVEVFARLHHISLESRWRDAAERAARRHAGSESAQTQSPLLLAAIDLLERGGAVVVEGRRDDPLAIALAREALAAADPTIVTLRLDPALWPKGAPGSRPRLPAQPAAMLCRGQVCSLPVGDVAGLRTLLAER